MGKVAVAMAEEIQKHVVDPELRECMIPRFTTTTETDVAVASLVMMGSLKEYFEYTLRGGCGFPSVTLLGEKSDWEAIATRIKKLPRYGAEPSEWGSLLQPILTRMVQSFETPNSRKTTEFWMRACYKAGSDGSGNIATLSGWITAFCFWDEDGKRIKGYNHKVLTPGSGVSLTNRRPLVLDGVTYPLVSPDSVPKAFISVPIIVGDHASQTEHDVTVVDGHVGLTLTEDRTKTQPLDRPRNPLTHSRPTIQAATLRMLPQGTKEPQRKNRCHVDGRRYTKIPARGFWQSRNTP